MMIDNKHLDDLVGHTKAYIETKTELGKLQLVEKGSEISGSIVSGITFLLLASAVIGFLSIALAFYLSEVLGKTYYGFLAVGGLYALISLLAYAMKDRLIKRPVANSVIRIAFKKEGHE